LVVSQHFASAQTLEADFGRKMVGCGVSILPWKDMGKAKVKLNWGS